MKDQKLQIPIILILRNLLNIKNTKNNLQPLKLWILKIILVDIRFMLITFT